MALSSPPLLTGEWVELTDLDDPGFVQFWISGSGPCIVALEVAEPVSGAGGAPCVVGLNAMSVPAGKRVFVQKTSGTATLTYFQFGGLVMNPAKVGWAYEGDGGADTDWTAETLLQVGWDDASTRGGANPYEFQAYMRTDAAGVSSGATIEQAILSLAIGQSSIGRTLRIYGVEILADQFGTISSWATLPSTLTAAYTDLVIVAGSQLQCDVKAIIEELQDLASWSTSAVIQFLLLDPGTEDADEDTRIFIDTSVRTTNLTILTS